MCVGTKRCGVTVTSISYKKRAVLLTSILPTTPASSMVSLELKQPAPWTHQSPNLPEPKQLKTR